jgi:hypothetical protein
LIAGTSAGTPAPRFNSGHRLLDARIDFAAQAVSIPPGYRTEVLRKYAEMDDTMATGGLWGVGERLP